MLNVHSLLQRQLKKYGPENAVIPHEWQQFITVVNNAYWEYDTDRGMLERALELSSQELLQANSELRAVIQAFPDVFLWIDTNGTILSYKGGSTTNLNIWSKNLVGTKIQDIGIEGTDVTFINAMKQLEKGKLVVSTEVFLHMDKFNYYYEARLLKLTEKQIFVIIRDITERKHSEEKLRYLSMHDALTGLYNRAYFEEEMNRLSAPRYNPVGLIICDVDGLKLVNDNFGHENGDILLIETARVLRKAMRQGDMVARIGGDEFAILIAQTDKKVLDSASIRIQEGIKEYNSGNPKHFLSLSIGISMMNAENSDIKGLFQEADNNMYKDKVSRRRSCGSSGLFQNLIRILEARDFITGGQESNFEHLMVELGKKLDFDESSIGELRMLAQFYEVSGIDLNEPSMYQDYHLNSQETEQIKKHCEFGDLILKWASVLIKIGDWILKHHECWDGSGYPMGLKAEAIPIQSPISAVAEAFDTMIGATIGATDLKQSEVLTEIQKNAGIRFNPVIVDKLIEIVEK